MSKPVSSAQKKWRQIVEHQRSSGLSVEAFCRQNGVAASSLFAWKRRLRPRAAPPVFVEAKVGVEPAAVSITGAAGSTASSIEIRLRGERRVRVGRGFDRQLLAQVVGILEGLA